MAAERQASGIGMAIGLPAKFEGALAALWEGTQYADLTSGKPWDYAVEIDELRKLGLSDNDLRFLVQMRYVEHACELTAPGSQRRDFGPAGGASFTKRSCFVLAAAGIAATTGRLGAGVDQLSASLPSIDLTQPVGSDADSLSVPFWDTERSVLYFAGQVVKQFRWQAANQQRILSVFQEDGWPVRIDDPLSPAPSLVGKQRLRDTIKCLNRKQMNSLLRFRGDGTGLGIRWETGARRTVSSGAKTLGYALATA